MSNLSHPISLLKPEQVNLIRSEAASAEKQGKLTKKQLSLINDQEWLKMLTPSAYGGKQMSLPDVLAMEEALACADGSVGWLVTLCAGAGWFGGFMNPETAKMLFETDKACLAGSGSVAGTAEKTESGYIVNGKWPYASGTPEAIAFTANCTLVQGGTPVLDANGDAKVISFVLLKNEVTIAEDWNAVGMVATSSHSFSVSALEVADNRAFSANMDKMVNGALYHYPFLQLSEATLAINLSGMAFHFMDLCKQIFEGKIADKSPYLNMETLMETYDLLYTRLQTARQKLYYAVDMSWQVCAANKDVSASVLYKVSSATSICAKIVRDCVNTLFPYCGLQAANKNTEINRVWRDIQTACQHPLLSGDGSI